MSIMTAYNCGTVRIGRRRRSETGTYRSTKGSQKPDGGKVKQINLRPEHRSSPRR